MQVTILIFADIKSTNICRDTVKPVYTEPPWNQLLCWK